MDAGLNPLGNFMEAYGAFLKEAASPAVVRFEDYARAKCALPHCGRPLLGVNKRGVPRYCCYAHGSEAQPDHTAQRSITGDNRK